MTIGENIKKYRVRRNITQSELAESIGVTLRMMQKYEAPEEASTSVIPSIPVLRKIAHVLDTTVSALVDEEPIQGGEVQLSNFYEFLVQRNQIENKRDNEQRRALESASFILFLYFYKKNCLEKITGMNVYDFYVSDAKLQEELIKGFYSIIIGGVHQNMLKVKSGQNKPHPKQYERFKKFEKNWDSINIVLESFLERDSVEDLLQFTLLKQSQF